MNVAELASIAEALAVVLAIGFGITQVRQYRSQRRREVSFALMQSLQTKDITRAICILDSLPDALSKAELEERLGDRAFDLHVLLGMWESLGIMVFHGEVTLDLVDDFYSGPIVQSWSKLSRLVEDIRQETGRDTRWEFFQWLAQQMIDREAKCPPVAAYKQAPQTVR